MSKCKECGRCTWCHTSHCEYELCASKPKPLFPWPPDLLRPCWPEPYRPDPLRYGQYNPMFQ